MLDSVEIRHRDPMESNTKDPTIGPCPGITSDFGGFVEIMLYSMYSWPDTCRNPIGSYCRNESPGTLFEFESALFSCVTSIISSGEEQEFLEYIIRI